MSSINLTRILPTKIYKVDNVLVDNRKRSKILVNIFIGRDVNSYLNTFNNYIRNVPNNVKKVYRPRDSFNTSTFAIKVDNNSQLDYYKELKANRDVFKIIKDNSIINKLPTDSSMIMDFSHYREDFNLYVIGKKKAVNLQYTYFQTVFNHIESQLPSKSQYRLMIDIDDTNDQFILCLKNAIQRNTKEVFSLLNKYNTIFVSPSTGITYKPDFTNISKKAEIQRLLEKSLVLVETLKNAGVGTPIGDSDVHVVDMQTSLESDEELYTSSMELSRDFSPDSETVDIHDELEIEPEDDPDNIPDTDSSTSDKVDEKPSEDETIDDFNLDEILDTSMTTIEEKIKDENKAFLAKMLPVQENVLKDIQIEADKAAEDKTLDILQVNDDTILNPAVKNVTGSSITNSYYKKQFKKDVLEILKSLNNDPEYPVVITGIKIKDNSTALSKIQEFDVEFTDKKMRKHTFKVDVPILSHDGFLYINGNTNFIAKQATLLPVIKESNERVQITTNYRKSFLYRKGDKINGQLDRLTRILTGKEFDSIEKKYGNSYETNLVYPISIPYNYMAKNLFSLTFDKKLTIVFSQKNIQSLITDNKFVVNFEKYNGIGYRLYNGNIDSIILEEVKSGTIYELKRVGGKDNYIKIAPNFIEYLTKVVELSEDDALKTIYRQTKPSISLSYTEVKILSTSVSLGALAASFKGIISTLQEFNIDHRISDTRSSKSNSEVLIPFKNAYLYIDTHFDPATELFVNGLLHLNTRSYKIEETTRMSPIFLEYYETATGSRNSAKGLLNFESSFIDPIVLEVLKELKLPTDFISLLMYGNSLLGDYKRDRKNDMNHFRVRDSEVISVALYNSLVDSFNNYKKTIRSGIPLSINVKRDDVIRRLQTMNNVEGYSTLNPVLEAEIKAKTTFKGPSGLTLVHSKSF